jgi:hypothetical protein
MAQQQRRDWRDSFSIIVHFWQTAPVRERCSRCPQELVFDSNNYMLQFIGPILMTASAMTNHTSPIILRTI